MANSKRGAIMVFQVLAYTMGLLLVAYLLYRCFGITRADRRSLRRQWTFEQVRLHYQRVEDYERRKAAGEAVGPPPRVPLSVAIMFHGVGMPLP